MSAARNALGRGLGALLPSQPAREPEPESAPTPTRDDTAERDGPAGEIPIDAIDPNPEQPRRHFDPKHLEELATSIGRHGVLQPVVVRRAGERFELIVGERRWRAARRAGLPAIPAVVADVAPHDRLELAIVENVQRHDLNPVELAHAYRALAEAGNTQEEIGQRVGKDRSSVANHLRLLDLERDLQEDLETGRMTMGHAKALLQIPDPEERRRLRDRVVGESLSVREAEEAGRAIAGPSGRAPRKRKAAPDEESAEHGRLAEVLQSHFQARVKIAGSAERGRIEIAYASAEDLDRISRLILEGF